MKNNTRQLSLTALFVALVFLLGLTPLGLITLGFINVTILCLPVIVGTILLGLKTGLLLGFFCDLDGDPTPHLQDGELALAQWFAREELPDDHSNISLTGEMIECFRKNGKKSS